MKRYDPHELAKAVLWEEAKGKMRAMIACDGCLISERGIPGTDPVPRYRVVKTEIEAFIKHMEENEFHI